MEVTLRSESPATEVHERPGDPCAIVVFGASGDLTKRLLMPAIYNLACDELLPHNFAIIGVALNELNDEAFRKQMSVDIRQFTTRDFNEGVWNDFVENLYYLTGDFDDADSYNRLAQLLNQIDAKHQTRGNSLFYLAVPPPLFPSISNHLGLVGLAQEDKGWSRIIVEKPFGHDLESAAGLDRELHKHWREHQIWRIDHYLGKETVQNILAFRFANGIFEPLWNNRYIDHVQFTVGEKVGVEGRGNYYDRSGVLRDMIQNHMLQMLAYVAMETPTSFRADAIRNEKVKVLEAVHLLKPEDVLTHTVRGQYSGGTIDGSIVRGYREEPDVPENSCTETFAAVRLYIDNWRWVGVPFYLRSGKRMLARRTEIAISFKRAPEVLFRETSVEVLQANELRLNIQPDQRIELVFEAKVPGPAMRLQTVGMHFEYQEAFLAARGTGYETLLYDCMVNDPTLFSRGDLVETAWRVAQPVLDVWSSLPPRDFPNYPAGSWGPKAAEELLARDGRHWRRF